MGERLLIERGDPYLWSPAVSAPTASAFSPWIFGKRSQDLVWFILPGLLVLLANFFIKDTPGSRLFAVYFFFDYTLIGAGHIYTTNWRTYFSPKELKRSMIYLWAPLVCFAIFFSWSYFSLGWLVVIPAYAQTWHHIRQSFGIQKWYQRQNRKFRKMSDHFVHLLCFLPFIVFHFREPTSLDSFLLPNDLLLSPNETLKNFFLVIYGGCLVAWIAYEVSLLKYREWNRLSFMAFTVALNGVCFIFGRNEWEIMFPLVAYHGASYFGLTALALNRTRKNLFSFKKAVFFILVTALLFGTYERIIEFKTGQVSLFWESVWAGIYVTPILCHYIYDAFLWRAKHAEAKQVFGGS